MLTALLYLVVMAAVAAVVYLFATLVFGRGEEMAPLAPGATPTTLPVSGVTGDDVRRLRFQQTVRGYKMSEVDWALQRLAAEVDGLRARLAELEGVPHAGHAAGHVPASPYDDHDLDGHDADHVPGHRGADHHGVDHHGADHHGVDRHGVDHHGADRHGAVEASASRHEEDQR